MANNFCSNCGNSLNADAKFCANCGAQIQIQPNSLSFSEYRAVLSVNYTKGFSSKDGALIFANDRIIIANYNKTLSKEHIEKVRQSTKGLGYLKRTAAMMNAHYTFVDRYWNMSPQEILSETPGNFEISINNLRLIKYTTSKNVYYTDNSMSKERPAKISVTSTLGKFDFSIYPYNFNENKFVTMLKKTYPQNYTGAKR